MSKAVVLDSSALLCLLNGEAGADRVAEALPSAVIGAVNLAEVVTKLRERGLSAEEVEEALGGFNLDVRPFTALQAYATGHLRQATRSQGLSLRRPGLPGAGRGAWRPRSHGRPGLEQGGGRCGRRGDPVGQGAASPVPNSRASA